MRISDWSSDVCSSDLTTATASDEVSAEIDAKLHKGLVAREPTPAEDKDVLADKQETAEKYSLERSEERRVGKEGVSTCRSRGSVYHQKKKQETGQEYETSDEKQHKQRVKRRKQ